MAKLKTLKRGWRVRRTGNPRTDVGRARKAMVFTVEDVQGDWRGYTRALLRGHGQAFWTQSPGDWEMAGDVS